MIQHPLGTYVNVAHICSVAMVNYLGVRVTMVNSNEFYWSFNSYIETQSFHNELIKLIEGS